MFTVEVIVIMSFAIIPLIVGFGFLTKPDYAVPYIPFNLSDGAARTAGRLLGAIVMGIGLLLVTFGFMVVYISDNAWAIDAKVSQAAYASGDHITYIDAVARKINEDERVSAFVMDYDYMELCIYRKKTLQAAVIYMEEAWLSEVDQETLKNEMIDNCGKVWVAPANVTLNLRYYSVEEYYSVHDDYIMDYRPQPDLSSAKEHIDRASDAWESKEFELSLRHAREAYWIKKENLGEEHPETQQLVQMMVAAQNAMK